MKNSLIYIVSSEYFGDIVFDDSFNEIALEEDDSDLKPMIIVSISEFALMSEEDLEELTNASDEADAIKKYRQALIYKMRKISLDVDMKTTQALGINTQN